MSPKWLKFPIMLVRQSKTIQLTSDRWLKIVVPALLMNSSKKLVITQFNLLH